MPLPLVLQKMQRSVTLSSAEAEFLGAMLATKDSRAIFTGLIKQLDDFHAL